MAKKWATQTYAQRMAAQAAAIETVKATAGVGESWDIYLKIGVARIYLGSFRGSKQMAKQAAKETWPKHRGNMTIRSNGSPPMVSNADAQAFADQAWHRILKA